MRSPVRLLAGKYSPHNCAAVNETLCRQSVSYLLTHSFIYLFICTVWALQVAIYACACVMNDERIHRILHIASRAIVSLGLYTVTFAFCSLSGNSPLVLAIALTLASDSSPATQVRQFSTFPFFITYSQIFKYGTPLHLSGTQKYFSSALC